MSGLRAEVWMRVVGEAGQEWMCLGGQVTQCLKCCVFVGESCERG